jgi:RHS repeat-associated protein
MKFEFEKRIEYIFDGWNVILEKATKGSPATAGNTILTKRYWGLDLSGSNLGAGGVGGLLATVATKSSPASVGTETHHFHYDANGNVTETIDSNGDLTASYEYGPFGELVSETGSYSTSNTYKFSTKSQDSETGYYYYGFRYYDAVNGRWLNRDPITERGGFNLYAIVGNETLHAVDMLGLKTCQSISFSASIPATKGKIRSAPPFYLKVGGSLSIQVSVKIYFNHCL